MEEMNISIAKMVHMSPNLGDYAQIIGIERILQELKWEVGPYSSLPLDPKIRRTGNEQIIMPTANYFNCNPRDCMEPFMKPTWCWPAFLGIAVSDQKVVRMLEHWFLGAGGLPILCRDRFSADLLQKSGFNGQFWGCASMLIPRRGEEPANGRVYSIDLEMFPTLTRYIPDSIKREMVELESQEPPPPPHREIDSWMAVQCQRMKEKIVVLRDTARLVITSRLHIALPCISMGIPVIKVSSQRDHRVQLVDSYIRAYRASEFSEIDWEPSAPDIEESKTRMLDIACDVMRATYDRIKECMRIEKKLVDMRKKCFKKLTRHYCGVAYHGYADAPFLTKEDLAHQTFFRRITGKYPKDVDLVFYGAGINGMHLLQSLYKIVKNCKSFTIVDGNPDRQEKGCGGYTIKNPECLHEYNKENLVVFVTPFGSCGGIAESISEILENEFSLKESIHFYFYETLIYSAIQESFGSPCIGMIESARTPDFCAWESRLS